MHPVFLFNFYFHICTFVMIFIWHRFHVPFEFSFHFIWLNQRNLFVCCNGYTFNCLLLACTKKEQKREKDLHGWETSKKCIITAFELFSKPPKKNLDWEYQKRGFLHFSKALLTVSLGFFIISLIERRKSPDRDESQLLSYLIRIWYHFHLREAHLQQV